MTDDPRRGANLSIPTIPNLRDVEVREAEAGPDESTDVVVRRETGEDLTMPTAPSLVVPGVPQAQPRPEGAPAVSVVDNLIAESLGPGPLPQMPTLSSLLVTPQPVAEEPAREPLRSLADQIPASVRETPELPADAKPRRSGLWVAFIAGMLVASAAIAVVLRLYAH
jgi:hypothetical protein